MALVLKEPVCLSYESLPEVYRNSEEVYCYKVSRTLRQISCFPCQRNEENCYSKGCHINSRIDSEESLVTISEDDFTLSKEDITAFTAEDNWKFLKKENKFLVFEKKKASLDMDEWCFLSCKHPIRFAYLSPLQLRKYEFLRGERIVDDIKAFSDLDKSFLEALKTNHPKIAVALEISKKSLTIFLQDPLCLQELS